MTDPEERTPLDGASELGDDWRMLGDAPTAWFDAPSLAAGATIVGRIAELMPGTSLPDIDLRPDGLRSRVGTGGSSGIGAGAETAAQISAAAGDLGLVADPTALQTLRLAVDTAARHSVMGFWRVATSYEPDGATVLRDPLRRDPTIRFDERDDLPALRSRFHVDVVRPPEAVEAVRANLGQEPFGVYGLTLADTEGNEADLVPGDLLGDGAGATDWRVVFAAIAYYPTTEPAQACALATAVAGLADDAGVPLLIDIRAEGVTLDSGKDLWEDVEQPGGSRFPDLAARIQSAARDLGLIADPDHLRFVQFGLDVVDIPAARDFWTAVLGYRHDQRPGVTDIFDPRRLNPEIIFQDLAATDERRRQRDRTRLELLVPADHARTRVEVAVAAGGRIVDDGEAGCCVLADPEGNELAVRWI